MNLRTIFLATLKRDLRLAFRHRQALLNPLLFFVIVLALFPLAIGPESKTLQLIGPGVIWVAALLAMLLALDRMFKADFKDGTLEQLLLAPCPLALLVLAKISAHWLVSALPLILITPLLGIMLDLSGTAMQTLLLTLLLGTPTLSLMGAIASALMVGLRGGGVLLGLLILPWSIPILIFATSAVSMYVAGLAITSQLALLGAFLVFALTLAPFAVAAALRVGLQ